MLTIAYTHPMDDEQKRLVSACGDGIDLVDCVTDRGALLNRPEVEILYGHPQKTEYEKLEDLRWVHLLNTGSERMIEWTAKRDRLLITCTRGHSAVQMAEHVIGGLFYLARDFSTIEAANRRGDWRAKVDMTVLESSCALVLGVGGIGKVVASKLNGLGVKVRGVNYSGQAVAECSDMYTLDSIHDHLCDVNHVINCLPNSEHTWRLIDGAFLDALAPGATLVNISRGSVVDEDALLKAIDSGQIRGAVLDVTWPEPPAEGSALYDHPRVLVTGHLSWKPAIPSMIGFEIFLANLKRYLDGDVEDFESVVDRARGY